MSASDHPRENARRRGVGDWAVVVLGIVICVVGVILALGGLWLYAIGGSFYYLATGIGLLISGILIIRARAMGAWLYAVIYLATIVWAFWEAGLNGWAL